ncbi:MAG: hypothetical protein BWY21_01156 [Parcubacteria group bacterium ADurb.Bin216]|nr:MAG: hypothetical protein BWY21_01156 [Parcubacteria group bacterium ADurb.Bin216]
MKKKIIIIVLLVLLVIVGIAIGPVEIPSIISHSQLQKDLVRPIDVRIILDKSSYSSGENIGFTIMNDYYESVYLSGFLIENIYKRIGKDWILLDGYCHYPHCIYMVGPEEFVSGQSKYKEWKPIHYVKNWDIPLSSGEYIISTVFRFGLDSAKGNGWISVYSNPFFIR